MNLLWITGDAVTEWDMISLKKWTGHPAALSVAKNIVLPVTLRGQHRTLWPTERSRLGTLRGGDFPRPHTQDWVTNGAGFTVNASNVGGGKHPWRPLRPCASRTARRGHW